MIDDRWIPSPKDILKISPTDKAAFIEMKAMDFVRDIVKKLSTFILGPGDQMYCATVQHKLITIRGADILLSRGWEVVEHWATEEEEEFTVGSEDSKVYNREEIPESALLVGLTICVPTIGKDIPAEELFEGIEPETLEAQVGSDG